MLGPSGFFLADGLEKSYSDSNDIELIHSSDDGFNELYRGCKNGRFFVYKALKKEFRGNILYEELLKKDFNIGFSLNHSGICQYYAMIDHPAVGNCIVMEWIDGCTLEELLSKGRPDSGLAQKIICELCDAVDYMHRKQVIHRDLKPENILITHNGQNVKVIDFGLSDADSYSTFKSPAGTRMYASPELMAGETIDGRSDIWSLGVIINELSGKYRHVSGKCLQRDRRKRFGNASEVKEAIMKEGARKAAVWIVSILLIAGSAIGVSALMNSTSSDTEIPQVRTALPVEDIVTTADTSEESVTETDSTIVIRKEVEPQPGSDSIDSSSLDELFNEASRQIL